MPATMTMPETTTTTTAPTTGSACGTCGGPMIPEQGGGMICINGC